MDDNSHTPVPDAIPAAMEPVTENVLLTAAARQHLCQTGPWLRFFSILMLIASGFVMLVGILMVLMGLFGKFAAPGPLQGADPVPVGHEETDSEAGLGRGVVQERLEVALENGRLGFLRLRAL